MPIKFDGSGIDEYWHIISGISLFESGNYAYFYNTGGPYKRGLLMSLWVGFWMALFGKSILVAKLAPVSVGIISYFLFLYLSLKLLDKKRYQILSLLLYTISPWSIYNHTFIRMYVMYELFLLILLVLGYKMYNAIRDKNEKKIALHLSFITILNILNWVPTTDTGKYLLPVASAVMLASLFIFEFNAKPKTNVGGVSTISGSILLSTETYRAVVVTIIAILAFIVLDAGSKIDYLINTQLTHTSRPEYKYPWLFWERNGAITTFFVLATATFWVKNNKFEKIILPVVGVLFLIHITSSEDLQIIRGVLYFMPLYYLTAVIGVSKIRFPSEWIYYAVICSIFLVATVTNVTRSFFWGPRITYENYYIEYARLYDSVIKNCHGNLIVEAAPSSPFIARFYGVNVDYVLSAAGKGDQHNLYFIDASTGKFKTVWGALPVMTDIHDLKSLNQDICLVVRIPSKRNFLPPTANDMLQRAEESWHFSNINLYLLKQEMLSGDQ